MQYLAFTMRTVQDGHAKGDEKAANLAQATTRKGSLLLLLFDDPQPPLLLLSAKAVTYYKIARECHALVIGARGRGCQRVSNNAHDLQEAWDSLLLLLFDEPQPPPLLLLLSEGRHTTKAQPWSFCTGASLMQARFSDQDLSMRSRTSLECLLLLLLAPPPPLLLLSTSRHTAEVRPRKFEPHSCRVHMQSRDLSMQCVERNPLLLLLAPHPPLLLLLLLSAYCTATFN